MRIPRQYSKSEHKPVSAQEIACWAYCSEPWRPQYGLKLKPGNRAMLKAGTRHHERKAVAERVAGGSIAVGQFPAELAGLVLLLWWVLTR